MKTIVKLLLVCDDQQTREYLIQQIYLPHTTIHSTTSENVKKEIDRINPQIALIVDPKDNIGLELVQYIHTEMGDDYTPLLLYIAHEQNFSLLRSLIRTGVNDYFIIPDEIVNLTDRLNKMVHVLREQSSTQEQVVAGQALKKGKGQIHTFYSAKGGVGCSLISTLYAQTMKFESTADVLFVDLNLQYGGAEKFLGIESGRSLADLLPVINELNENHIHNVIVKEPFSKMDLLLSPRDAEVAEQITEEHIIKLLRTCRRTYDIIVVDIPSVMDTITYAALEEAEIINYVMSLDTPSISTYKQVTDLFKKLRLDVEGRLQILVNRVEKNNELSTADIKDIVSARIVAKIKEDKKGVYPLINKGEPLRKELKEKKLPTISKDVRKWVLSQLK